MVLAEHADEAMSCYPSQATIADATEQSVRTVRSQLADLEAAGLITRQHRGNGQGGRTSDRYTLLVPQAGSAPNPAPIPAAAPGVSGNAEGAYRQPVADEHPLIEHHLLEQPLARDDGPAALVAGFDRFWSIYPNKRAKGAAEKAWPKAVKLAGGIEVIVQGAQRYRDDPNRSEAYTSHPSTWLNSKCWADGPLPERGTTRGGERAKVAAVDDDRTGAAGRLDL